RIQSSPQGRGISSCSVHPWGLSMISPGLALYVYTARPGEIIDNPQGWTLQLEIPRPWADESIRDKRPLNHTFYGYPTIAPISDDEFLVVITERARMQGAEQADLYYFRMGVKE
ncbi:MAG: hypothetical protein R6U98_30285, partial [Pirellulaceae bacterium]